MIGWHELTLESRNGLTQVPKSLVIGWYQLTLEPRDLRHELALESRDWMAQDKHSSATAIYADCRPAIYIEKKEKIMTRNLITNFIFLLLYSL